MKNKFSLLLYFIELLILILFSSVAYAVGNSIVAVDQGNIVGEYTSLVLDSQDNPIISYYDRTEDKLKVVHCVEKNCAFLNIILTPDSARKVGQHTSLTLDDHGNPVIAYYDHANSVLKVLHCGNSSCSMDNTITTPDSAGMVGQYTAIIIDNQNRPVISYYDVGKRTLKVLHCGNVACTANNKIVMPDLKSSNGMQNSITLDEAGNPVVAYFDFLLSALKILHCGNANCTVGNKIAVVDAAQHVGYSPSLVLDKQGKPVVSYLDLTHGKLKVLHCGDTTCSTGNSIISVGHSIGNYFSSIVLDRNGNPVVIYYNLIHHQLNILQCGNADCSNHNRMITPAVIGQVGQYASLKLDANGYPVISYYDTVHDNLKLLHCGSLTCGPNTVMVADNSAKVGQYSSLKLDANGYPVISYWDEMNGTLKLLHCGDATCTTNNSISNPDSKSKTGWDTSLVLDSNGYPVISYYDFTHRVMTLLHCSNPNCTGENTITKPDRLSRRYTSIALDTAGHPVIASSGKTNQGLRLVHCGNATCTANNTFTSPDLSAHSFQSDIRGVSLKLDANGYPVVSYYQADKIQLKVLHCANSVCGGINNSVAIIDSGAHAPDHRSTSLTIDAHGHPIVAYQDIANNALKILHCGNPNCTSGNSIASPATGQHIGSQPSIQLDTVGNPVVSYDTHNRLTVLHCGNLLCTAGNKITTTDTASRDTSLALDADGLPVISYYNPMRSNLTVLYCGTSNCQ